MEERRRMEARGIELRRRRVGPVDLISALVVCAVEIFVEMIIFWMTREYYTRHLFVLFFYDSDEHF